MIVVDASVLVAALVGASGAGPGARERLRGEVDVHVPHLFDVEVTAALRRRLRLGQISGALASEALAEVASFPALRWDHGPLLPRVWELRDLTEYDAAYVALAEALGVALITADARLARASGARCPVEVLRD